MGDVPSLLFKEEEATERRSSSTLTVVARRGPLLRSSPVSLGTYGLDLTAGCDHGCPFCYIQGSTRYPGRSRVYFDPRAPERLTDALNALEIQPETIVLSPSSDPLPAERQVRAATERVIDILLKRQVRIVLMTRGRLSRRLIGRLAEHRDRVRVGLAFCAWDRKLWRTVEPRAASPRGRARTLKRLIEAEVPVEVRLEPIIPELTDTVENLKPLFTALARAGARVVLAHYLFLNGSISDGLSGVLAAAGLAERMADLYQGGPVFPVGTWGSMKHLPRDTRQAGFARLSALAAERGLLVQTGATQNPDLTVPVEPKSPAFARLG
jgi:DNA repair photolyase